MLVDECGVRTTMTTDVSPIDDTRGPTRIDVDVATANRVNETNGTTLLSVSSQQHSVRCTLTKTEPCYTVDDLRQPATRMQLQTH